MRTRCEVMWWNRSRLRLVAFLLLASVLVGCAPSVANGHGATLSQGQCTPNDQDQYVYDPGRLHVVQACMRVTGTIEGTWVSSDGDTIVSLHLDPPFEHLLTPGNFVGEERGNLGVEAVCTVPPVEAAVIGLCAGDPDPVVGPYPASGLHVWVEGRYIYDLHHESHAELHPLYRIGVLAP
jgi:hypothetical protein